MSEFNAYSKRVLAEAFLNHLPQQWGVASPTRQDKSDLVAWLEKLVEADASRKEVLLGHLEDAKASLARWDADKKG